MKAVGLMKTRNNNSTALSHHGQAENIMKKTIEEELIETGYRYRDNEDGTFDVCYDHDQDANFTEVNMYHVATVKDEGDLWCVNGNTGAGWGEYPKEDWTLERSIYDQCIEEHIYDWMEQAGRPDLMVE